MLLGRRAEPFDHPDWLFELKYDGFRALAFIEDGQCRLVSRNENEFKSFGALASVVPREVQALSAILDGEIVCFDARGRSNFRDLFYRRSEPVFAAFDLIAAEGCDLRAMPLLERKRELRRVLRKHTSHILFCDHVEQNGCELFRMACDHDLEGIVAKGRDGRYTSKREDSTWFKIRNRFYSQWEGREEMFERERVNEYPQFRCDCSSNT